MVASARDGSSGSQSVGVHDLGLAAVAEAEPLGPVAPTFVNGFDCEPAEASSSQVFGSCRLIWASSDELHVVRRRGAVLAPPFLTSLVRRDHYFSWLLRWLRETSVIDVVRTLMEGCLQDCSENLERKPRQPAASRRDRLGHR